MLVWAHYDDMLPVQSAFTKDVLRYSLPIMSALYVTVALVLALRMKEVSREAVAGYRAEIDGREMEGTVPEHI